MCLGLRGSFQAKTLVEVCKRDMKVEECSIYYIVYKFVVCFWYFFVLFLVKAAAAAPLVLILIIST